MNVAIRRRTMSVEEFLAWEERQELRHEFDGTWLTDPVVVFEVLSETTSHVDLVEKLQEYTAVPSMMRYVLLEQDHVAAIVYARQGEAWVATALTGDAVLDIPEIGIAIPLPEICEGLDLAPGHPSGDEKPQEIA